MPSTSTSERFMSPEIPAIQIESPVLQLESTLKHLHLYDFQLEASFPGKNALHSLQANPLLPGVILTEKGQLFGMISRRRFLEQLSRPYGLELFLQRPLKALYRCVGSDFLILPGDFSIVEAANQGLQRLPEFLYEPIVVELAAKTYRLLDIHQLLVAQAKIHQLAVELLHKLYQELGVANQELQRQASLDGLTQVANRRKFDQHLAQEWLQISRQLTPISIILADVDFFKRYNDTYGHQAGDDCLRQIAHTMAKAVKRSTDLVARYGGEEFAIILPNTDAAGALLVAEEICSQVKELKIPHKGSQVSPFVTLSLGVASSIPDQFSSPEFLIAEADKALYQAKTQGRNQVVLSSL